MRSVSTITAITTAAVLGAGALAAGQAAPAATPRMLTVFERGERVALIDNPPKMHGPHAHPGFGDALAFNARITNAAGASLGHLYGSGTFADNHGHAVINAVYDLAGGQLDLTISATPGYTTAIGSITGGTGAYAGARGTDTSTAQPGGTFKDTIALQPGS